MMGVKQFFPVLAVLIVLAFFLPASAQLSVKEVKLDRPIINTNIQFKFDMPDELQSDLPQDEARIAPKPKSPRTGWLNLAFLGPIIQFAFYILIGAAVSYILYLIISSIIIAKRNHAPIKQDKDVSDIPIYQPDKETARILLQDADELAAQGKFEQAVHAILFRSIQDIEDKRPHHVKRSLTSREIAGLDVLSTTARAGFSTIGRLVERSFFGGLPLGAEDYALSKSAYKDFAFEKLPRRKRRA